jgi:hypothetical protein
MIIGVVVKVGDNIEVRLPAPSRHHHCFAYFAEVTGKFAPATGLRTGGVYQGFYTDKGVFLDREKAFKHAKRCGQLINQEAKRALFSEDIW